MTSQSYSTIMFLVFGAIALYFVWVHAQPLIFTPTDNQVFMPPNAVESLQFIVNDTIPTTMLNFDTTTGANELTVTSDLVVTGDVNGFDLAAEMKTLADNNLKLNLMATAEVLTESDRMSAPVGGGIGFLSADLKSTTTLINDTGIIECVDVDVGGALMSDLVTDTKTNEDDLADIASLITIDTGNSRLTFASATINDAEVAAVATNAITVTRNHVFVDASGGAAALHTITGGVQNMCITLSANAAGDVITVHDLVDNVHCAGGNYVLDFAQNAYMELKYDGTVWTMLNYVSDDAVHTHVGRTSVTNNALFTNLDTLDASTGTNNLIAGVGSGVALTTGQDNTAYGNSTLMGMEIGKFNTAVGYRSLEVNNSDSNTCIGRGSARTCSGTRNTVMGTAAGEVMNNSSFNSFYGHRVGQVNVGNYNLWLGNDVAGDGSNTQSHTLYIGYNNSANPLIRGHFTDRRLWVNGMISIHPDDVVIAAGVITATTGFMRVGAEGGAGADNLATINGAEVGAEITLQAPVAGNVITVQHGVGNIVMANAADFVLTHVTGNILVLKSDGTNWHSASAL